MWDQRHFLLELDETIRNKGEFICLLGGKSTGKSMLLKKFSIEKKDNRKVIYIDMRTGYATITDDFISVISANIFF